MRLSSLEKAGLPDPSRIYEGLHLAEDFIKNMALNEEGIEQELREEGERHFGICEKCRNKKNGFLPFDKDADSQE